MRIDWFTVIAQVVNFLILMWLLKRFLYKPILNAIDAREQRIAAEPRCSHAACESWTTRRKTLLPRPWEHRPTRSACERLRPAVAATARDPTGDPRNLLG